MSLNAHATLTKPEIHDSYDSLGLGAVGFMMFGLGNILAAEGALTYPGRMSWVLQFAGPICICLLFSSYAADEEESRVVGGRRRINKNNT